MQWLGAFAIKIEKRYSCRTVQVLPERHRLCQIPAVHYSKAENAGQ